MCVIFVIEKDRPAEEDIRRAYSKNSDGGGAAWRELDTDGQLVVKFKKGLDEDAMVQLNESLPVPFVLHFRIGTVGGALDELCHPFPVEGHVRTATEGTTRGDVLFHNGHWGRWKSEACDTAIKHHLYLPSGPWSDSRALAWFTHHIGPGFAEVIEEKICLFGPDRLDVYGSRWVWMKEGGFLASNNLWEYHQVKGVTVYYPSQQQQQQVSGPVGYHTQAPVSLPGAPKQLGPADALDQPVVEASKQAAATVVPEVATSILPLAQALRLFRDGQLSKNRLKKSRRLHAKQMQAAMKAQKVIPFRLTDTPTVLH